ncbi:MAG: hypothetical protein ACM3KD_01020 [Hyphomicrobiaceae bacterium]
MKQIAQQVRTKFLTLALAAMAGTGVAAAANAAGLGAGINADIGAGPHGAMPDTAQAGGKADAHVSPSGSANGDAQWQSGATRGEDRAAKRMNAHGADSRTATTASATGKR